MKLRPCRGKWKVSLKDNFIEIERMRNHWPLKCRSLFKSMSSYQSRNGGIDRNQKHNTPWSLSMISTIRFLKHAGKESNPRKNSVKWFFSALRKLRLWFRLVDSPALRLGLPCWTAPSCNQSYNSPEPSTGCCKSCRFLVLLLKAGYDLWDI